MTKDVYVTAAQRDAARLLVERAAARGRPVSPSVQKIADAIPAHRVADRDPGDGAVVVVVTEATPVRDEPPRAE